VKQALRYLLVVSGAVAGILMFVLASASENTDFFERHYPWLLGMNLVVAVTLLGLVVLLLARLVHQFRSNQFGSRLMLRLVLLFAAVGILPGVIIYVVSVQFVSRSIESWFNVQVESALESGIHLSQSALDETVNELSVKGHNIALELSDLSDSAQTSLLARQREQARLQELTILNANGRVIVSASAGSTSLIPDLPTSAMLREARTMRGFAALEGVTDAQDAPPLPTLPTPAASAGKSVRSFNSPGDNNFRARVVVLIPPSTKDGGLHSQVRFLQLIQAVPKNLGANAEAVRVAYGEYQARYLARSGLRKIYITTLTITLLLAIFGAIASAFLIASKLAKPLLLLAEGTRAVAEGDLSPRPIIASNDELGTLTQSFNTMTHQLLEARTSVEKNRADLEHAKARLESVLANMSAGVMVLDGDFVLVTYNQSVERILQHGFAEHLGQQLASIVGLSPFVDAITRAFSEQSAQSVAEGFSLQSSHWQKQIEIPRNIGGTDTDHDITLLTRGSRLPVQNGTGYILVFDDISGLISAERSIAWGEVARRLAHEIKNPLTPIQLSAERMQMKLQDKLFANDLELLSKGTSTIVSQVSAMKRMVDDFRDYAKTPPAVLSPLDLNSLITEILNLYIGGDERDIIHVQLADDLPFVMGDPTQLRQVIHNLLQNAQDATLEKHKSTNEARIDVITEVIRFPHADGSVGTAVRMSIEDNGPGFAPTILARAFEPYVTSKSRGTGLGLAMVKKIIDEHGGRVDIHNRLDANGAQVLILLLKLAPR
jgi:nitrogen fixation/metabolism regulation signal transduction histidine kinase